MNSSARQIDDGDRREAAPRGGAFLAGGAVQAMPSPVAALQQGLEDELVSGYAEPSVKKIPPGGRLAIVTSASVLSWAAIIWATRLAYAAVTNV